MLQSNLQYIQTALSLSSVERIHADVAVAEEEAEVFESMVAHSTSTGKPRSSCLTNF